MHRSLPLCLLLVSACGVESGPPEGGNAGHPVEWTLVEEVRIADDARGDLFVTTPVALALAPDGELYVGQQMAGEVRIHAPSGELLGRFGTTGNGPGEYQGIAAVSVVADTVYVSDQRLRRVTLLERDGSFIRTERFLVDPGPPLIPQPPLQVLPGGNAVATPGVPSLLAHEGTPITIFLVDRHGEVLETLVVWLSMQDGTWFEAARGAGSRRLPTSDSPLWAASWDGTWFAKVDRPFPSGTTPPEFTITLLDLSGGAAVSQSVGYDPTPMDPAVADSAVADAIEFVAMLNGSREGVERRVRDEYRVSDWWAPVDALQVSEEGDVWVRRERPGTATATWEVYRVLEGVPSVRVELPAAVDIRIVTANHVWAVVRTEFGVPEVVRYRIER